MSDYAIDTTKGNQTFYYVPGFFRLKVKNFTQMNLDNLDAQMNATIIFSVYYGSLGQEVYSVLENGIILLFGRDDALKLDQNQSLEIKMSNKPDKHEITFTVRKLFHLRIDSDVFWSPFQIINLILSITVQPVKTPLGQIKINLLDHPDGFLKLSYTEQGTFGNYDLAQNQMQAEYSNDRVCTSENFKLNKDPKKKLEIYCQKLKEINPKSKIQHFQYAHFNIPLYKYPIVAIATIFLPLWLLAIINLGIFFQDSNLADRIASIAGLMIAFVALIPTIRDQIPPNPKIVFIEILVYFETLTSLFALIHSLDVRGNDDLTAEFVWYQNGLFMISFIITILTIIIVIVMMLLHYFVWEPSYNRDLTNEKEVKFIRKQWKHQLCDLYYQTVIQKSEGKINVVALEDPAEKKPKQKQKKTEI